MHLSIIASLQDQMNQNLAEMRRKQRMADGRRARQDLMDLAMENAALEAMAAETVDRSRYSK